MIDYENYRALSLSEVFGVLEKLEPWTLPVEITNMDNYGRAIILTESPISDETRAYFDRQRPIGMQIVYCVRGVRSTEQGSLI